MKNLSTLLVVSLASAYLMSGVVIFAGEPEGPGGFIFSAFTAQIKFEPNDACHNDESYDACYQHNDEATQVKSRGNFTLDPLGDGIDPVNEEVIVKIGDFVFTVPAGSFALYGGDTLKFKGAVGDASVKMDIKQIAEDSYAFYFKIKHPSLVNLTAPTTLFLSVGDDFGEVVILELHP